MKKTFLIAFVAMASLVSCSPAFAEGLTGSQILSMLPVSGTLGTVLATIGGLAHLVAWLPPSVKDKFPSWLLAVLDMLAANYGSAKNEDRMFRANRRGPR